MKTQHTFNKAEEKIYTKIVQEYLRDGIGPIDMGLFLLCSAVGIFLWPDSWIAQFVILAILFLTLPLNLRLKKKITFRRLGYAEILFHPPSLLTSRVNRNWVLRPILQIFVLGFATFVTMAFARYLGSSVNTVIKPGITHHVVADTLCVALLSMSVAGLDISLGIKFFWTAAVSMLGCVFLTGYFLLSSGWPLLFAGLLIIVFGIARLRRFLRENPRVEETDAQ